MHWNSLRCRIVKPLFPQDASHFTPLKEQRWIRSNYLWEEKSTKKFKFSITQPRLILQEKQIKYSRHLCTHEPFVTSPPHFILEPQLYGHLLITNMKSWLSQWKADIFSLTLANFSQLQTMEMSGDLSELISPQWDWLYCLQIVYYVMIMCKSCSLEMKALHGLICCSCFLYSS